MRFNSEILGLPAGTDVLLRELVHERTGIYFDAAKSDLLMDKLSPLIVRRGFTSFLDYYYLLKYDDSADAEWGNVMNALSVQETFFWREIDQINALVNTIVPHWFASRPGRTMRIWSAACATGEEPLTIAMVLKESGWLDRVSIEIDASDASSTAIEKARQGLYRERAFRNLSPERRARYFQQEKDSTWRIDPDVHECVKFSIANLVNESDIARLATADVIFCRNVFIYFSEISVAKTARYFKKRMLDPGYLFVGASESLMRLNTGFVLEEIDGAFVYVKES
jgi:chemotaxis protein methyltransferase CheR